jgi:acetyl esterase/lipase
VHWLLLSLGIASSALTLNVFFPVTARPVPSGVSFFAGWFTAELALHHVALQCTVALILVYAGALAEPSGAAGLALCVASWMGLLKSQTRALASRPALLAALEEGLGRDYLTETHAPLRLSPEPAPMPVARLARPFHFGDHAVEVLRGLTYHDDGQTRLRLDLYRPGVTSGDDAPRPVMIYVHGGGWVVGDRARQGLPMLYHLAERGWLCATISYRKSPRATFPDHLIDVKRAVAWVRAHAAEHGGDPSFMLISGGSAGGHLASLAALTPNDPTWQPGFEEADTRLSACVSFYGVYDFLDRFGHWPNGGLRELLKRFVMKTSPLTDRAAWNRASPISHVRHDAPPFLLLHGTHDSLVPIDDARAFAKALRGVSKAPVVLAEFDGAQHAFEVFSSARTVLAHEVIDRFTAWVRSRRGA